jgi:hypothetical protein
MNTSKVNARIFSNIYPYYLIKIEIIRIPMLDSSDTKSFKVNDIENYLII